MRMLESGKMPAIQDNGTTLCGGGEETMSEENITNPVETTDQFDENAAAASPVDEELLMETIEAIRPSLVADGGDLEYRGLDEDGVVSVKLTGACSGCPLSSLTLSMGIERILKEHVPGVTSVRSVL